MLVLSRKQDERVTGYANVKELREAIDGLPDDQAVILFDVLVTSITTGAASFRRVKLGFECPGVVRVVRQEKLAADTAAAQAAQAPQTPV